MASTNPYLTFDGNCEAAFSFYKSVFGGDFSDLGRFKDMPSESPLPEEEANKILHIELPIGGGTVLKGSDSSPHFGPSLSIGNNISIAIDAENETEAYELFNNLSKNGMVTMPLEKTFWGALFGMFTDKFGINWMLHCPEKN